MKTVQEIINELEPGEERELCQAILDKAGEDVFFRCDDGDFIPLHNVEKVVLTPLQLDVTVIFHKSNEPLLRATFSVPVLNNEAEAVRLLRAVTNLVEVLGSWPTT